MKPRRNVWVPAVVVRPAPVLEAEEYTPELQSQPPPIVSLKPESRPRQSAARRALGWQTWCAVAVYLSGAVCMLLAAFSKYISPGLFFWPAALSLLVFWGCSIALAVASAWGWIVGILSAHLPHHAIPGSIRSTVHSR